MIFTDPSNVHCYHRSCSSHAQWWSGSGRIVRKLLELRTLSSDPEFQVFVTQMIYGIVSVGAECYGMGAEWYGLVRNGEWFTAMTSRDYGGRTCWTFGEYLLDGG